MRKGALLIGFLFTFSSSIQSQSIVSSSEKRADQHYAEHLYAKAAATYEKLVRERPENKRAALKLARIYFQTNRLQAAFRFYSGVIHKKYLVNSQDYLNYAQILSARNMIDSAEWWTMKYLEYDPVNESAQNLLFNLRSFNSPGYNQDDFAGGPATTVSPEEATLLSVNYGSYSKSYILTRTRVIEVMSSDQADDISWLENLLHENKINIHDRVNINPILFDKGQSVVGEVYKTELQKLAELMKNYELIEFEISGHTDSSGSEARNLLLSRQRAGAARDYLLTRDIQTERLLVTGYGEKVPIYQTPHQDGQNRRLEFRLVYMDKNRMISSY